MDFVVSEDQRAMAGAVRATCAKRFALDALRAREWTAEVVRPDDWRALADMGVFSLRVPPEAGGLGLGLAAAAVVFEELGRALVPGPLVATELVAALGSASGSAVVPWTAAAAGEAVVGAVRPHGPPLLVEHLDALDALVLVDDGRRQLTVVDRGALQASGASPAGRGLDPLGPVWQLPLTPPGEPAGVDHGRWRRDEQVLTGALCVGIAAVACELAVDYAGQRHQFGRPIGSFQAVKHLCADMLVRAETARAAVHAAAVTADQPEVGDPVRAAAGAALVAADAATANAKACLQVHGGVGFTWDVPVHLYLTRARALAIGLGAAGRLARTVAEAY